MREFKFRAWAKRTIDHYISDPIEIAYTEFENSEDNKEPDNSLDDEWNIWYDKREKRIEELRNTINSESEDRYEIFNEMITNFSIKGDGRIERPYEYEILDVMQYTGIKDKNGIEICEGDVVKIIYFKNEYIATIAFNDKMSCFEVYVKHSDGHINSYLIGHVHSIEVIGNIYENPELLESEIK